MALAAPKLRFLSRLNDFSAGLDTSTNDLLTQVVAAKRCMNVIATAKTRYLQRRAGFNTLGSQSGSGNGMRDFKPVGADRKLVAKIGTSLYAMTSLNGVFTSIFSGLQDALATLEVYTAQNRPWMVILSDAGESPLKWNGVDAVRLFGAGNDPLDPNEDFTTPIGKIGKVWRGRFYMSGFVNDPTSVRFTEFGTFDMPVENSFSVDSPSMEGVTGFGVLRNNLYVFTPYSISRVTFTGGDPLLQVNIAVIGVGCSTPRTIKTITYQGREMLCFLGTNKRVYLYDGYTLTPATMRIEVPNDVSTISMQSLNDGGIRFAHAVDDSFQQLYHLFVPNLANSQLDHRLVFDYSGDGAWWPYNNQNFQSSVIALDSNGQQQLLGLSYSGVCSFLDVGNTDNGASITSNWLTAKLASATTDMQKGRSLDYVFQAIGNTTVQTSYRSEFTDLFSTPEDIPMSSAGSGGVGGDLLGISFVLGISKLGAGGSSGNGRTHVLWSIDLPVTFNYLEVQIESTSSSDPWVMEQLEAQGFQIALAYGAERGV